MRTPLYAALACIALVCASPPSAAQAWDARFTIQLGAFGANAETTVKFDADNGLPGTVLNFETDLNFSDSKTLPQLDFLWRWSARHALEGSYVSLKRDATRVLSATIRFGDVEFPLSATVNSTFDSDVFRVAYRYSPINEGGTELGFLAGVHYTRLKASIATDVGSRSSEASLDFPLPTVGVRGAWRFADRWRVTGFAQALKLKYGDNDGALYNLAAAVEWAFMPQAYAGLAYNYYKYEFTQNKADERIRVDYRFDGPMLYLAWAFR